LDSLRFNFTDIASIQFKQDAITGEIIYSKDIREKLRKIDEHGISQMLSPEKRKDAMGKYLHENNLPTPPEAKLEYELGQMAAIFKIDHSFRIRGKKNEKVLVKYRFYLDSALTVTKAEEQDIKVIDSDRKK
jgi:hypothetical protein